MKPSPPACGPAWLLAAALLATPGIPALSQEGAPGDPVSSLLPGPGNTARATAARAAKQIQVTGGDPGPRAALADFAESVRGELRQIFREPDDSWVSPVEIRLSGTPRDVVSGVTAAIQPVELLPGGRFEFVLLVRLHRRYDEAEVARRLVQLLLYERMTRPWAGGAAAFPGESLRVPWWLTRGIEQLTKHRGAGRPSDLYAGLLGARQMFSAADILDREEGDALDPVSEAVFAASAAALVAALLDQPGGPESMRGYLGSLASSPATAPEDEAARLRQHFPGLRGSPAALEKWWSLQLASMGQLQAFEFFTVEQTDARLEEALAVALPPGTAKPAEGLRRWLPQTRPDLAFEGRLQDFERFSSHEQAAAALGRCQLQLQALGMRAFPLYRGLILRYELAAARLAEGKTRGIAAELRQLDQEREGIRRVMEQATDYMNFFEATRAEGRSKAHEEYRRVKNELENERHPPRQDRVSRSLDAMEREFASP